MIAFFKHEERTDDPDYKKFKECFKTIKKIKSKLSKLDFYRTYMQDFGDNIRSTDNPFECIDHFKGSANKRIRKIRDSYESLAKDLDYIIHYLKNADRETKPYFSFFVIDCFRNPNTARFLRKKYSNFHLISLYADEETRLARGMAKESKKKNFTFNKEEFRKKFREYDERDQGEDLQVEEKLFKQNVTETCLVSDIAINNEGSKDDLFKKLIRYLGLIFDPGCTKPTRDEVFMNMAYAMSMRSNCISRQVGAVIVGKEGYVVGAGWNDVGEGQISCGLKNIKDLKLEAFSKYVGALGTEKDELIEQLQKKLGKLHFCFCFKDEMSVREVEKQIEKVCKDFLKKKFKEDVKIKLLKYCKALHAEENAIIQGAKIGGMGIMGSSIYTTTFPCELCAKKIQQSGIKEVIYTEPYPRSISRDIYLEDGVAKVSSRQFEGVKPFGYFKLFKPIRDEKEWQELNSQGLID